MGEDFCLEDSTSNEASRFHVLIVVDIIHLAGPIVLHMGKGLYSSILVRSGPRFRLLLLVLCEGPNCFKMLMNCMSLQTRSKLASAHLECCQMYGVRHASHPRMSAEKWDTN